MMKNTIGFNDKKNIWTSKYDFISSNYASVKKSFFSCSKSGSKIFWEHHKNDTNNNFYGTQYSSAIAVSFNDNLSQNKIYKSFSIEGSKQLAGATNLFSTSEIMPPNSSKYYVNIGSVKDKGGILYAHMGRDPRVKGNVNLKYLGSFIPSNTYTDYSELFSEEIFLLKNIFNVASYLSSSSSAKILLSNSSNDQLVSFNESGSQINLNEGDFYIDVGSGIKVALEDDVQSYDDDEGIFIRIASGAQSSFYDYVSTAHSNDSLIDVFVVTDNEINGDFLRGQYAEAAIDLGSGNFELYSLNVNYEPTDLDHSK